MNISVFYIIYPKMKAEEEKFFLSIFKDINKNCFEGMLQKPTHLGRFENLAFEGLTIRVKPKKKFIASAIIINPLQKQSELITTIAHEMIHLFQVQFDLNLDHGRIFKHFQKHTAYYLGVNKEDI